MLAFDLETQIGTLSLRAQLEAFEGTTVIIGPNGAGKSTLLKSLLGQVVPKRGSIQLGSEPLFDTDARLHIPTEERCLGYVPQRYALFPHMTVLQNVAFGIRGSRKARKARALELLEDLGVERLAKRKTGSLSGGEAQRVALARAMAISPRALLLDEPMAALDAGARRSVRKFLAVRLRAIGIPCLVVSHDIEDAEVLADRIAVLEKGEIVQVGTIDELRAKPASAFVRQFLDAEHEQKPGPVNEIEAAN